MTSYTDIFTGNPIQSSPTSYRAFTIAASTELSWPLQNEDSSNVTADVMEVTASSASLNLTLPPANQVGKGKAVIVRNVGANTFTVKGNTGTTIQAVTAGQVFWIYVTDNSTVAGTWSSFQYGTGTSSADAATLAGYGLVAVSSTLNLNFPVTTFNSSDTLTTGYRAQMVNWTGGAGVFSFSSCVTLSNGWFVLVKNSGSGALTLDPNGAEMIDGVSSVNLNIGDSCIVSCDGTSLYTIGKNSSSVTATFTRLVKSVAGSSNVTLTSAEAAYDIQEYTGAITASISVIVPTSVGRWWVYNNTSGAFSLTVKTAAGTGVVIVQGTRQIVHCDGTNVVLSVDAGTGTVTSVATGTGLSGGPITATGTIALANTTVSPGTYGATNKIHSIIVDAQGRITTATDGSTAALSGANTDITSLSLLASINGGQIGGFRNKLINGDFRIWQRSTSAIYSSSNYIAADRWGLALSSGGTLQFNQSTSVPSGAGFQYSAQIGRQSGTTSTGQASFGQVIESSNSYPLQGKTVTLSFYAKAGANYSAASSLLGCVIRTGTGTDQSFANMIGGTWTGDSAPLNESKTLTTSWQRFTCTAALIPSSATQVGAYFYNNGVGTAGADDNFYITGIQLEIGSVATTFEDRGAVIEFGMSERYYEKSFEYATAPAQNAGATGAWNNPQVTGASTSGAQVGVSFKTRKRSTPTITFYNTSAANAQIRNLTTGGDCTATAASTIGQSGFGIGATTAAGSAAGNSLAVHWTADSEL